ncbi:MAG: hypothetical protein KDA77_15005, partial [Planctomycetaceae bacterium]|nr:hypothetical protein [Planctomycetaceae bacterium]
STTPADSNDRGEEIRRFFEQRMRERMGIPPTGGDSTPSGGSPFGGRSSRGFQFPGSSGGSRGGSRSGRGR